jgi:hypothetical protein
MHFVLFVILYTYGEYRTIRYTGQITTAASLGKSGGQNQMMTLFANLSTFLLFRESRPFLFAQACFPFWQQAEKDNEEPKALRVSV